MKILRSFPKQFLRRPSEEFHKMFHSRVFTLFASGETYIVYQANNMRPHFRYGYCYIRNLEADWFTEKASLEQVRKWIIDGAKKGTSHVTKLYHRWSKDWAKFKSLSWRLQHSDLRIYSDQELYDKFAEYYQHYMYAGSIAYCTDAFASEGESDWLEDLVGIELRRLGAVADRAAMVRLLTRPAYRSFILQEEQDILRLAIIISRYFKKLPSLSVIKIKVPAIYRLLLQHQGRYHWIQNNYSHVEFLSLNYFYRSVAKAVTAARKKGTSVKTLFVQKERELVVHENSRQRALKKYHLSPQCRNILKITELFGQWKDIRKSGVQIAMYHFRQFLAEIARRTGTKLDDIYFLTFHEIADQFLKRRDMGNVIAGRKQQTFFAYTKTGTFVTGGRKAASYFTHLKAWQKPKVTVFKGASASPGRADGRVRIVRSHEHIQLFKKGEILVANQTTPEFVPAIKKAAAIVTEQGGITSHAAIISRELNTPCVIGTKIATKVLKDGDKVEVDATKGIVRKI